MSFNLLFEMAAAIGTQRMVELCEHYLWVMDNERADQERRERVRVLDASGAVIPPAWRDRGSRSACWSDCSGVTPTPAAFPATPERRPGPVVCPGAPRRPSGAGVRFPLERIFNSPQLGPSATGEPVVRALDLSGAVPENQLDTIRCPLHEAPSGVALGYSRNSSGNYATFAPLCSGCPVGSAEATE